MAKLFPFKGLHPRQDLVKNVSVLPYDVVTRDEAKKHAEGNPFSFFNISRPEICLSDDIDPYSNQVYMTGKKNLDSFIQKKILIREDTPKMYLYTLVMNNRKQTGLVACFSIDDYINKIIKKHELTIEAKEKDRTRHLDILNANTGLVFFLYREDRAKKALFDKFMANEPLYDFTADDGIRHIVRSIDSIDDMEMLKKTFSTENVYIADGHHRAASAVSVGINRRKENKNHTGNEEYNRFLGVLFPHSELKIYPYNRVVRDLNGLASDVFLDKISARFRIIKNGVREPVKKENISLLLDSEWYTLELRESISGSLTDKLDVMILQKLILDPILNIKDPRIDRRIGFLGGVNGADELERSVMSGEFKAAFSMYPTSVEELMEISSIDEIMPPKSTWFEPKLRSGLFIHLLG